MRWLAITLCCLAACESKKTQPTPIAAVPRDGGYWTRPLAPQGPQTPGNSLESSLLPNDCGTCHPAQLADWKTTLHAHAMSPGLEGQLLHWKNPTSSRSCDNCHAPLFEQRQQIETTSGEWANNSEFDPRLRKAGITCSVCHVRGRVIHGPPPQAGPPRTMSELPHNGFEIDSLFESSEMCAACHQFPADWRSLNGKLLENTYEEWKVSPAAAEGKTCQSCHMPGRRHLFRGIHDLETTRSAFAFDATLEQSTGQIRASARLRNVGAGHMAPTYVTPRIVLDFQLLDAAGQAIGPPSEPTIIQRLIDLDGEGKEIFDTRLAPGKAAKANWQTERIEGAASIRVQVRCIPDHFYEELYAELLTEYAKDSVPYQRIAQALLEAQARRFVVFERLLLLD